MIKHETNRELRLRRRLEIQGYDLSTSALRDIGGWIRWAPGLCALAATTVTALQSATGVWALALVAALGAALPNHPFDHLYNHGLRFLTGTGPLPKHGGARRFSCGIATAWLVGTGVAFHQGLVGLGLGLGAAFVVLATSVAVTNFCLPSLLYQTWFGTRRDTLETA